MKWQPPIPKGAIVEARDLGPGLALLGYCYDEVKEGGLLEINLHDLCPVLGTSYATIRRWWAAMQRLGIIERVEERGRKGIRAYVNRDWIDWRQAKTSSEMRSEIGSNMSALPETSSGMSTNNHEMRSEMRSEMSTNSASIRYSDQSEENPTQEREREDRDRTARSLSQAVEIYKQAFPQIRLTKKQVAFIVNLVGEGVERFNCWRATVQDYELTPRWKPENLVNMEDRFNRKLKETQERANGMGTHQSSGRRMVRGQQQDISPERDAYYKQILNDLERPDD